MAGYDLAEGRYENRTLSDDEMWSAFSNLFSSRSKNSSSYKFGFLKAIMDNLYNVDENLSLTFDQLFETFTEVYWNLVLKHGIRQQPVSERSNGTYPIIGVGGVMTPADAKAMLEAHKKTGKKLTIGYQNRQTREMRHLKPMCEAGVFGDIYFGKAHAIRRRAVPTWGVFMNEEEQGGGPIIDIATHSLDLTLYLMNNYKPKMVVGTRYKKVEGADQGNPWGGWGPDENTTLEDAAFGFIVMENGATIVLESSWALNMLDVREATTLICGTKAGGDLYDGVRINGIRNNSQYILRPTLNPQGAAFYEGANTGDPASMEAAQWINAVVTDTDPCVLPEQAFTITRILEGIYESAKTGKPYYFD